MTEKKQSASLTELIHMILPSDTNAAGNLHGGVLLKLIDSTAAIVAMRHSRKNCVTVAIENTKFLEPVFLGELIILNGKLIRTGNSSMNIEVTASAENLQTGKIRHTNTALLTFVALDEKGKTTTVPKLLLETND